MNIVETLDANKKPLFKITSDKLNSTLTVKKSNDGYSFYDIVTSKGHLPEHLKGKYLTCDDALKAVEKYLLTVKKSPAKRRDETYEENHKVAPKSKPSNKEHL